MEAMDLAFRTCSVLRIVVMKSRLIRGIFKIHFILMKRKWNSKVLSFTSNCFHLLSFIVIYNLYMAAILYHCYLLSTQYFWLLALEPKRQNGEKRQALI